MGWSGPHLTLCNDRSKHADPIILWEVKVSAVIFRSRWVKLYFKSIQQNWNIRKHENTTII